MITAVTDIPFPHPPESFLDRIKEIWRNGEPVHVHYNYGGDFSFIQVDDFYSWVHDNICDDFHSVGTQTVTVGGLGPHIDARTNGRIRYWTLMYVIYSGEASTNFYHTTPDLAEELYQRQSWALPYDQVTKIKEFRFKENTWNLMNNQCLHSVQGVTSARLCLSINFNDPRPKSLAKLNLI